MDKIKKANALFTTIGLQLPQTTSAAIRYWEGELINNSSSPAQICAELEKITMQNTNNIKMARKMINYGRK